MIWTRVTLCLLNLCCLLIQNEQPYEIHIVWLIEFIYWLVEVVYEIVFLLQL